MARTVTARWTGGQSATVEFGTTQLAIGGDAPELSGIPAPYPTELLLASVASCFAIAMAFVAAKRGLELPGLEVDVAGDYDGLRVSTLDIAVRADADQDLVSSLIAPAERLCYVTNSLREAPDITIHVA